MCAISLHCAAFVGLVILISGEDDHCGGGGGGGEVCWSARTRAWGRGCGLLGEVGGSRWIMQGIWMREGGFILRVFGAMLRVLQY